MRKNKIIFMGTPDFAVESLKVLMKSNYNILGVVTSTVSYFSPWKSW